MKEQEYDFAALQQALQGKSAEFVLRYLADVLAKTEGAAFQQFLRRAAVFRQPVPCTAYVMCTVSVPLASSGNAAVQGAGANETFAVLEKGVNLTLFEKEAQRGCAPVYWVTPVIREGEWSKLPPDEQRGLHMAAYHWYDGRIAQHAQPDPDDWAEAVHHALAAGNIRGACKPAIDLGLYLRDLLLYRESMLVQQRVADRIDATVIAEAKQVKDEQVAILLNNLGESVRTLGDARQAIGYYEQALAIDRAVSGDAHPAVARDLNNLGGAYDDLGEHRKALGYFEQVVAIFTQFYGREHPWTRTVQGNLDAVKKK